MTLDDQLAALRPLKPGQVAELAGLSGGGNQLGPMRARGGRITAPRLREVARRLRALADDAEGLIAFPDRSGA